MNAWGAAQAREPGEGRRLIDDRPVEVPLTRGSLGALLYVPPSPRGAVLIAQPSGIGRLSRQERFGAHSLARAGFTTLLVDLLTEEEDAVREGAHTDVPLLADRLLCAARWLGAMTRLPLGYLGVGTAAVAALVAAATEPARVLAVVSRGSRPDHAGASLLLTRVPSLFIVAGNDPTETRRQSRRVRTVAPSPGGDRPLVQREVPRRGGPRSGDGARRRLVHPLARPPAARVGLKKPAPGSLTASPSLLLPARRARARFERSRRAVRPPKVQGRPTQPGPCWICGLRAPAR